MSDDEHVEQDRLVARALDDLPADEARAVDTHVRTCRRCAGVEADVRVLTTRLADGGDDLLDAAPPVPPAVLDGVVAAVRAEPAIPAPRPVASLALVSGPAEPPLIRRRSAGLLAAAAGLLLVVAVVGGVVGRATAPGAPTVPRETVAVRALTPGVTAQAGLIAHTWGVEVDLGVTGLRPGAPYTVVLLDEDGAVVGAGGLVGTGDVQASCSVTAPLLRNAATGFRVMDDTGQDVLSASF